MSVKNKDEINLTGMAEGVYVLRIISDDGKWSIVKKIVVSR
jgi:hypothetical protein